MAVTELASMENAVKSSAMNGGDKSNIAEKKVSRDYEEVLKEIGFGKTQWIVLLTSGLLMMMVINETMGMSILTIASQCDFATNSIDKAVMSGSCFIGILLTSYIWGYFSDILGRRTVLLYATFTGNFISFISLFVPTYWPFVFLRLLTGCFIAGASSTIYAYLGEFFILRHRPVIINYASSFVGVATVYIPAVAWGVLSFEWSFSVFGLYDFQPWRLLIILYLLPGFIGALILVALPESPKLLLAIGKEQEALDAVYWIHKMNNGKKKPFDVFHLKAELKVNDSDVLLTKTGVGALKKIWLDTRPLFRPPHVLNFFISCTIMFGLFVSSSGMGLWYPEIQNRVGADAESKTVCQVIDDSMQLQEKNTTSVLCDDTISRKSYIDSITVGLIYVVGYVVMGFVINPIGRKRILVGSLIISGVSCIILNWIKEPTVIVVIFCLYITLPGVCVSVLASAVVDLVPTHLRGKAVCICMMLGRSGSVIGSNIIGILLESYCIVTFSFFSGFVLICAGLALILPI